MSRQQFRPYTAYVVDAVRTAGGRRNGSLSKTHPADLGAVVLNALVSRNKIDASKIDDVVFGCVSQIGAQGGNIARSCVLSADFPISVPATTVDRQCGSSLQAIQFATQAVMSGTQDVVIAGGVENMSQVPIGSAVTVGMEKNLGNPFAGELMMKRFDGVMFSQFNGAELLAAKHDVSRDDMERLAVASHAKAAAAQKANRFKSEIVPVTVTDPKTEKQLIFAKDEGVRPGTNLEALQKLKTLRDDGRITAATSSQITDGAAAVLICNERGLQKLNLRPRARIVSVAVIGDDPEIMLGGPIPATRLALSRANLTINDMDIYEVNEAFASVPLAWAKNVGADLNKLNVNGGAMALGHPLGATGAKLTATLLNELERRQGRYGLIAICEGGGLANATIFERVTQWPPATGNATAARSRTVESEGAMHSRL